MRKIVAVLLLLILSFSFTGELYRVSTDREFGFFAVRSNDVNHKLSYTGRTLNINTGDTVGWVNDDYNDNRITVISENALWEGGKVLGHEGNFFDFIFNSSGRYRFRILESSRFIANNTEQNTSVYNEDTGMWTSATTASYEVTNFLPRYQTIVVTGPTVGDGTYPVTRKVPISTSVPGNVIPNDTTGNNAILSQPVAVPTPGVEMIIFSFIFSNSLM